MAVRSSFPLLTLPNLLLPLSLIVATAQALNQPSPRDAVPASAPTPAPLWQLCHAPTSYLAPTWAVIRRKYQTALQGQLSFVDMVQLVALCGIVQGIRLWRKRSFTQKEPPGMSKADPLGRKAGGNTKASSQILVGTSRQGWFRCACTSNGEILMQ